MFLLYGPDLPEPGTDEARKLFDDWDAARGAMEDAGVLIDCAPLYPVTSSTTVRVRGGETLLTDGPAAEIKEQFGGGYPDRGGSLAGGARGGARKRHAAH